MDNEECRRLPWNYGSMLDTRDNALGGGSVLLGSEGDKFVTLFRLQAPWSRNSHVATVNLFLDFEGNDIADEGEDTSEANVIALVTWGTGVRGKSLRAFVDFANGTQFSVSAATLEVSARFQTPTDGLDNYLRARVSSSVAWGGRGSSTHPQFTLPRTEIESGGNAIFEIPPFAHSYLPYANNPAFYMGGGCDIEFMTAPPGNALVNYIVPDGSKDLALSGDGIKFPGNSKFVRVTNNLLDDIQIQSSFMLHL